MIKTYSRIRFERFKYLSKALVPFFRLENIELSFNGYRQTLHEYENLDIYNPKATFIVARDLILWMDYLGELKSIVSLCVLKLENRKLYLESYADNDSSKSLMQLIKETKGNQDLCKFYLKELNAQIKFLQISYKYAVSEYNEHI